MSAKAESRLQRTANHYNFGPWSAKLECDQLLDIRHRGMPALRGLRAVVRNHNWLTLTPSITSSQVRETAESLRLILDVTWKGYTARYTGRVTLLFQAESLTITFQGAAVEDVVSNRIGLVVLHRPDEAGRSVCVTSPAGNRTELAFPTQISPHQPFKDIAALEWERDQTAYRLDFDGDVFETEDQRNWTDASFKTYSTPLSKPFPVTHRAGDDMCQSIRLSARQVIRVLDDTRGAVPELGTSTSTTTNVAPGKIFTRPAGFGPLLAEIAIAADPALGLITAVEAAEVAGRLNLPLDARIVVGTPDDAVAVLRSLSLDRVTRLSVYNSGSHVTENALWEAVAAHAKELGFQGELVAGARSHFTELNRNRDSAREDADGVTYSITPQMHTSEPDAIIETLPMQTLTAQDALRIGRGRPLHIGPVTLAYRFNAVATQPPLEEELPTRDILQDTPFAAAWLLGSVTALTLPGTASISYATIDDLGTPAGQLLRQLATHRGSEVLATDAGPETIAVYPVRTPEGIRAYTANLTADNIAVRLISPSGKREDISLAPWQTATSLLL